MTRPSWAPGTTLAAYAAAWRDMAPHLGSLVDAARAARTVVEFGVRGGVSSWAFLTGLPPAGRLVSVDHDQRIPQLVPAPVFEDPRWHLLIGDSLDVRLPARADVVLVDTNHELLRTHAELERAAGLQPRLILAHDYLDPAYPGVAAATAAFTAARPWRLERVEPSHWGLAFLVPR